MSATELLAWAWVLWLALALIFVVIEVFTLDFTFLMLAGGALGGLATSLLTDQFWVQIVVAGIAALVLLFLVRPPLLAAFRRGGDPTPSNVDALLGLTGVVVLGFVDGRGQVKLANGETWTSRLADEGVDPGEGTRVSVIAIEGATAVVVPAPSGAPSAPGKDAS